MAKAKAEYGVVHLKMMPAITTGETAGAYPDFDKMVDGETGFSVKAIVKDSFNYDDTEASTTNIEIEDSDDFFATIKTDNGQKGFTVETYDLSDEAMKYLLGYAVGTDGWLEEGVTYELPSQAVEILTRKLEEFPSMKLQWAKMSVSVIRTGSIGKSGLPSLQLKFVKLANFNKDGEEVSGARRKAIN